MSVCTVKEISASSRISFKQQTCNGNDVFYTVEFSMTKTVPQNIPVDLPSEEEQLWQEVHSQVDKQVVEITNLYKK